MKSKVSDKWKSILEADSVTTVTTHSKVGGSQVEHEIYEFRLLDDEAKRVMNLAQERSISFDEMCQELIQMAYDLRLHYKKRTFKHAIMREVPRVLDGKSLKGLTGWRTYYVVMNKELVSKTCITNGRRSNQSDKEMPTRLRITHLNGEYTDFEFYIGSTIRMVLANYELFEQKQKLIKLSMDKHK